MSETRGLRFDLYERVHLAESIDGFEQLDQIELLPYIQVDVQDDQVMLRGHLKLSGQFADTNGEPADGLEHDIPVEITLPRNRISSLEEIGVEIEHFDVDLIAPRTLNVTGVLQLNGVALEEAGEDWGDREEKVFIHEAAPREHAEPATELQGSVGTDEPPMAAAIGPEVLEGTGTKGEATAAEQTAQAQAEARSEPASDQRETTATETEAADARQEEAYAEEGELEQTAASAEALAAEEDVARAETAANGQEAERVEEAVIDMEASTASAATEAADDGPTDRLPQSEEAETELAAEPTATAGAEPGPPEAAQEVRVAISGRKPDSGQQEQEQAADIPSLLYRSITSSGTSNSREETAAEPEAAQEPSQAEADETAPAMGWKSLFLGRTEDEQESFSSLKMCIVQKEETLDTIAERYNLNPREIALYNRLGGDPTVQAGQVLYIPK